jgi:Protein of unknown function (DUF3667)
VWGDKPRFCGGCGQETTLKPPTVREFVQQLGGAYFSTEGALWRTLLLLMAKPGELTRQYLVGRRKHYVLPLRLYLTISVITLLLLRVLTDGATDAIKLDLDTAGTEFSMLRFSDDIHATVKDGVFTCMGLPPWLCKRLERRMGLDPKAMQAQMGLLGERAIGNIGPAMFFMLPVFALLMKLLYWRRRLHYTEHLVFALHLHAFWFVALALAAPFSPLPAWVALLAVPIYGLMAMRRVYGGGWWGLLTRASVASVLYLLALLLAVAGVFLWALLA